MVTPMKNRPYILSESNWKDIKSQPIDLVVLPWGATEAHNYHLPYGTDNYQVEALAAEAGRIAYEGDSRVMILPVVPFGGNTGQADIRLDMNMNPSTQLSVLREQIEVPDRPRVRKLPRPDGHGGTDTLPAIADTSD